MKYEAALMNAWERLEGRELITVSSHAMAPMIDRGLIVRFLDSEYVVEIESRRVSIEGEAAPSFISVLVLHYLLGCGPRPPTGELVTFREIPGGEMYYPAFKARAIDRISRVFGERPRKLVEAGHSMGGVELTMGDASIELRCFPKIVIAFVVWQGDEEIPPSSNILFDSGALDILPMEDLSVVGNLAASKLAAQVKEGESPPPSSPEVGGRG